MEKGNLKEEIWKHLTEGTERMITEKEEELRIKLDSKERARLVNIIAGRIYGDWVIEAKDSIKELLMKKVKEMK